MFLKSLKVETFPSFDLFFRRFFVRFSVFLVQNSTRDGAGCGNVSAEESGLPQNGTWEQARPNIT